MKARMFGGARLKVDAGAPSLAEGVGGGTHHAREPLDPVKLTERRLRQDSRDGLPQRIVHPRAVPSRPRAAPPAARRS